MEIENAWLLVKNKKRAPKLGVIMGIDFISSNGSRPIQCHTVRFENGAYEHFPTGSDEYEILSKQEVERRFKKNKQSEDLPSIYFVGVVDRMDGNKVHISTEYNESIDLIIPNESTREMIAKQKVRVTIEVIN